MTHARQGATKGYYKVTTAVTIDDALEETKDNEFDLLLCQLPFAEIDTLLEVLKENYISIGATMVLKQKVEDEGGEEADCRLFQPDRGMVLDRMKALMCRKRGPRKGWKLRRELCAK